MRRDLTLTAATALLLLTATNSLGRVFASGEWRAPVYIAIVLPLVIGTVVRRLDLHGLFAIALSSVAFVVYLDISLLPHGGGLLPGWLEWDQFTTLLAEGILQFREELAPTLPFPGLVLLAAAGTYWVTALVHELLVSMRRPGLALLPAAVLWAVPLAVPQPPGRTWPFAVPFLAAAALVLLLESEADVAGWYRDAAVGRLSSTGLAVGTVAIAIAAVAPGLLPGYQDAAWYEQVTQGGPPGYQPLVDVGDRLKMPAPRDVLEVRSERPLYLRIAALDTFDGNAWRIGPAGVASFSPSADQLTRGDEDFPPEVPLGPAERVSTQIRVLDLRNIYVPVPYQPVRVLGDAREEMVYSEVGGFVATVALQEDGEINGEPAPGVIEGLEYGVVADLPAPTPEQVLNATYERAEVGAYLQLPPGFDAQPFAELAAQQYAARGVTTPIEQAFALQDYFIGEGSPFTYSTDVDPLLSSQGRGQALQTFLFEERIGYCEYYATAMAVMLRATGVPARVAVGFLPGRVVETVTDEATGTTLDTYLVSTEDAHAWVEVLQPGFGWLKFDPTPRSAGDTFPPTRNDLDPLQTLAERTGVDQEPRPRPSPVQDPGREFDDLPTPPDQTPGQGGGDGPEQGRHWGWLLAATALLASVGAALYTWRAPVHLPALPSGERVLAAQRRLHRAARRLGLGRRPAETSAEVAARWAREGRVPTDRAERFTALVHDAAFSGVVEDTAGREAEDLAGAMASSLSGSVSQQERLTAPLRIPAEAASRSGRALLDRVRDRVER